MTSMLSVSASEEFDDWEIRNCKNLENAVQLQLESVGARHCSSSHASFRW